MQPVYLLVLQYQYQCGTTQLLKILKAKVPQRCLHVRGLQGRQYVQICTVYQTCSSWSHLALSNSQYIITTELHLDSTSAIWHYKQALWTSAFFCSAPLFTASLMICSPCIYWYCSISISVEQHSYLRHSKPKSPKDVLHVRGLQGRQYVQICTVYQTCSSWSHLALSNSQYSITTELHLDSTSAIWHYKQAL